MKKLIQISICLMILILNMHTVKAMNYQAQIQVRSLGKSL